MNVTYVMYFVTAYEQRSFLTASQILFVTPQGLGQGIRRLENSLGEKLFERTAEGLRPTIFAEQFYAQAKRVEEELLALESMVCKKTLRDITVSANEYQACVYEFFRSYVTAEPPSPFQLHCCTESSSGKIVADVLSETADIGIVYRSESDPGLCYFDFGRPSRLFVHIPQNHPVLRAGMDAVSWAQLAELKYIAADINDPFTSFIRELCAQKGFLPDFIQNGYQRNVNVRLLEQGNRAMFLPEWTKETIDRQCSDSVILPIAPECGIAKSICWRKSSARDKDFTELVDAMCRYFHQMQSGAAT